MLLVGDVLLCKAEPPSRVGGEAVSGRLDKDELTVDVTPGTVGGEAVLGGGAAVGLNFGAGALVGAAVVGLNFGAGGLVVAFGLGDGAGGLVVAFGLGDGVAFGLGDGVAFGLGDGVDLVDGVAFGLGDGVAFGLGVDGRVGALLVLVLGEGVAVEGFPAVETLLAKGKGGTDGLGEAVGGVKRGVARRRVAEVVVDVVVVEGKAVDLVEAGGGCAFVETSFSFSCNFTYV